MLGPIKHIHRVEHLPKLLLVNNPIMVLIYSFIQRHEFTNESLVLLKLEIKHDFIKVGVQESILLLDFC